MFYLRSILLHVSSMSNQQTLITSIKRSDVYSIVYLKLGESLVKKNIRLVLFPLNELNDKTTVVFVVSHGGAEIFDLLAAYEILAQ